MSAYHPQNNGLDERINTTLTKWVIKLMNNHQMDWEQDLDWLFYKTM